MSFWTTLFPVPSAHYSALAARKADGMAEWCSASNASRLKPRRGIEPVDAVTISDRRQRKKPLPGFLLTRSAAADVTMNKINSVAGTQVANF